MIIDSNTKLYTLIGNPIDGTLSPIIHNYIFEKLGINSKYIPFQVEEKDFINAINGIQSMGVSGFNITVPYKEKVIERLDYVTEAAKEIGAINTVKNINGKLIGTNTDGAGFLKIFEDNNINLKDKNILVIGAGGASRGICFQLIKKNIGRLTLLNRTESKAVRLKKDLEESNLNLEINVNNIRSNIDRYKYDILINTTTVGMTPDNRAPISLDGFNEELTVFDVIYKPLETPLLKDAKKRGYKIFNGLPMLINQGILAQEFWLERKLEKDMVNGLYNYINNYLKEK